MQFLPREYNRKSNVISKAISLLYSCIVIVSAVLFKKLFLPGCNRSFYHIRFGFLKKVGFEIKNSGN